MSTTIVHPPAPASAAATGPADLGTALRVFLAERSRLFGVALRVVGDVATAEDVVQEAWLRWQRVERAPIRNAAAFLTTTTSNLAVNVVQSARRRHEVATDFPYEHRAAAGRDAVDAVESTEALAEALLLLMHRLPPEELAAYVLRKGFDYPYRDIAAVLRTGVANARQLVHRARLRLADTDGPRRPVTAQAHRSLVSAFLAAARTGRLLELEALLLPPGREASVA